MHCWVDRFIIVRWIGFVNLKLLRRVYANIPFFVHILTIQLPIPFIHNVTELGYRCTCRYFKNACLILLSSMFMLVHAHSWWRHQMEIFSALLALCAGNSPVPGEFPAQRPVTRSFGVFFVLRPNKRLNKQPWGWWFQRPSWSLWRQCNVATTKRSMCSSKFLGKSWCHTICGWRCYSKCPTRIP